jgi:hypothetical protein
VTIQDLGSIGEIIGAVATVATLLYLATQIRQNTSTARGAAAIAANQSHSSFNQFLAQDPDANQTWWKGLSTPDDLSESEKMQFLQIISCYSNNIQQSYDLYAEGSLSASSWSGQKKAIQWAATQPGYRAYWKEWGAQHNSEFASFMNEAIVTAPSAVQQSAAADSAKD